MSSWFSSRLLAGIVSGRLADDEDIARYGPLVRPQKGGNADEAGTYSSDEIEQMAYAFALGAVAELA